MSTGAAASAVDDLRGVAARFQRSAPRDALAQIGSTLLPLVALLAAMHLGLALG